MRIASAGPRATGAGTWKRRVRRDGRCAHRVVATSSPVCPGRPYPVRPVESTQGTQTPDTRHIRAALQGRALDTPLGWYRLQESWSKLTVKALRYLVTPGKGLHEAIVDLILWRARQDKRDQHIGIPCIKWGQYLTHDTDNHVTHIGTTCLRQAPSGEGPPGRPEPPGTLGTGHRTQLQHRPPRHRPPQPRGQPPPPTYRQRTAPGGGLVYSPRTQALLRSVRRGIPRPTMGPEGDPHHACPRDRAPRGNRRTNRPTQGPQGRPPTGQPSCGPRPGPNHLKLGRLPPGLVMGCLSKCINRRWPSTAAAPWIWVIPTAHTQVEAGPDRRKDPPPRPQQPLTCGYHAIHRVLRRMSLSPPLKYPCPSSDQEVHNMRTHICKILAAAAMDGEILLRISRPTRDPKCTPLQADTNTDTLHATPPHTPYPRLPSPHPVAHTRPPARTAPVRATQDPPPARTPTHTRHRRPCHASLAAPHSRQPTNTRHKELYAPGHTHPTQ